MGKVEIALIRHGISSTNETGHVVGWTDVPLSQRGIIQLKEYKETVCYPKVERFYSSDLQRTVNTFDILFSDCYSIYRKEKGLRENWCGKMENITSEENQKTGFCAKWLKNERYADEETLEEFYNRVNDTFESIVYECIRDDIKKVGLVLHEGSMKCIMMKLNQSSFDSFTEMHFPNGLGINLTLEVDEGGIRMTECSKIEKKQRLKLTLIRHGISTSNEAHLLVGWTDVDLSENGIKQLKEFKETVKYPEVERFYSSDLKRATQTFDILFGDKYSIYRTSMGLREVNFGKNDGMSQEENKRTGFYDYWLKQERYDDEELFDEFKERVITSAEQIIRECVQDGIEKAGIVLHEGSIKCIIMALENREFRDYNNIRINNGLGITLTLEVSDSSIRIIDKQLINKKDSLTLVLVRHGISVANEMKIFAGWSDYDLGESGVKELEKYRDTINYPAVDRFYCSPLLRAKRTFDILFGHKQQVYEYSDNFKENYYGSYENTPNGPLTREYFNNWFNRIHMGDEEILEVFQERVMNGVLEGYTETKRDGLSSFGIVAHAGVLKTILLSLKRRPFTEWHNFYVPNGLGYILNIEMNEDELSLISMILI